MKKIFFIIGSISGGGAEKQCFLQAKSLASKGFFVIIFLLSARPNIQSLPDHLEIISLADLSKGNKLIKGLNLIKSIFYLRKFLKKNKESLLYSWLEIPQFIGFISSFFTRTRHVFALRNCPSLKFKSHWKMNIFVVMNRFFSSYVDLFVSNSYIGLKEYKKMGYKIQSEIVISNFISIPSSFSLDENKKAFLVKKHNIKENQCVLLSASRLTAIKNIEEMIKAVFEIRKNTSFAFKWIHLGGGNDQYTRFLNQRILDLGLMDCVEFIGKVDNIKPYLQLADIFFTASISEGCSNSLLEAISYKKFCLSTAVGDAEYFLNTMALIDSAHYLSIQSKLIWAFSLDKKTRDLFSEESFLKLEKRCDPDKNANKLFEAFNEIRKKS